jgi:hypothetical protein
LRPLRETRIKALNDKSQEPFDKARSQKLEIRKEAPRTKRQEPNKFQNQKSTNQKSEIR